MIWHRYIELAMALFWDSSIHRQRTGNPPPD